MKKLLGSALALALVFPAGPASAELLKNLKWSGGIDTQANSSRNVKDFSTNRTNFGGVAAAAISNNDRVGDFLTRVWVSGWWDLLDDVHAKASVVKNDRPWGTIGGGVGGGQNAAAVTAQTVSGAPGTTGVTESFFVQEAYMKADKLMGHVDATVGRQFYGDAGDLVVYFGPRNTYGLFVTALDAVRADVSNDWMNLTGVAGKITGSALSTSAGADVDLRGIDVGWKMLPMKLNTFAWNRVTHAGGALGVPPTGGLAAGAATGLNDFLWVYGVKLKGEAMGGWVSVTAAANAGQNRLASAACAVTGCAALSSNYQGRAFLLDAGYKMDVADVGGFTPWINWGWGSGRKNGLESHNEQFTSIASDYRPGVIYGRYTGLVSAQGLGAGGGGLFDLNQDADTADAGEFDYDGNTSVSQPGLGNRIIWGGGLKFTPAAWNKFTAGASYWDFSYQQATRRSTVADATNVGNRHIGSEIDLQLDWAHSENVLLSAGWATFQPGGFIKEQIRGRLPTAAGGAGSSGAAGGIHEGSSPLNLLFADMSVRF